VHVGRLVDAAPSENGANTAPTTRTTPRTTSGTRILTDSPSFDRRSNNSYTGEDRFQLDFLLKTSVEN
jgi:hypothetical protein